MAIINQIHYSKNEDKSNELHFLIFDSHYDIYFGAIWYFQIKYVKIKIGKKDENELLKQQNNEIN